MKTRKREEIGPIHLLPQDTINLYYKQIMTRPDGSVFKQSEKVLSAGIAREMVVNEAVIFDIEEGDFVGVKDGLGGAFLSTK